MSAAYHKPSRYVLRLTGEDLAARASFLPVGLQKRCGALTAGVKFCKVCDREEGTIALLASSAAAYAVLKSGCVRDLTTGTLYLLKYIPRAAVTFCPEEGVRTDYVFGDAGGHALREGAPVYVPGLGPASVGAVFRERLFLAEGSVLSYSAPLEPEKFSLEERDTGRIALSDVDGDILALIPYGDTLVIFRKKAILLLRADANDLYFSFSKVKFDGGSIIEGSIATCGRRIVFWTERGLCTLEGSQARMADPEQGLSLSSPASAASCGGLYFACAEYAGQRGVFVFDPETGERYLADLPATHLAAKDDALFAATADAVYRAAEGQEGVFRAAIRAELDLPERARTYVLESIALAGEGAFTLTVEAKERKGAYALKAYEWAKLRHTEPIEHIVVAVESTDPAISIRALTFKLREEGA